MVLKQSWVSCVQTYSQYLKARPKESLIKPPHDRRLGGGDESVLYRVVMDVIDVVNKISVVLNGMFPKPALPQIRQDRIWMHSTRRATAMDGGRHIPRSPLLWRLALMRSPLGMRREKSALINIQRVE